MQNATAAVAFALALGVSLEDIVKGLEQAQGAKGRLNFLQKRLIYLLMILITPIQHLCVLAQVLLQQNGIKVMVMGILGS